MRIYTKKNEKNLLTRLIFYCDRLGKVDENLHKEKKLDILTNCKRKTRINRVILKNNKNEYFGHTECFDCDSEAKIECDVLKKKYSK